MSDFASCSGVAVVSGGTGGLGAAVCRRLAEAGCAVAFTYRSNADAAQKLVADLEDMGVRARAAQLDLVDAPATLGAVTTMAEQFGGIHTLVHAAGPHVPMVHLSKVKPDQFADQLQQEGAGFFNLVHAALPALREGGGSVVAITTAATTRYPTRDGLSAGPKAAVESLARAFAREEGRFGVRVNCVGPGMLTDGMARRLIGSGELDDRALTAARSNIPLGTFGTTWDIAEAVCFLASDRARYITGQKLDVDGGFGI